MRVLLVEDDELLGDGVRMGLIQYGYSVDWVKDGKAALHALLSENFDCVVLDLGLPKISGLEVLKAARAKNIISPVVILSAKESIDDKIEGLNLGADDYIVKKPFDLGELCARIRAVQRRSVARVESTLSYRDISLEPASRYVFLKGEKLVISRREFALLQKFLENVGRVLSREQLTQTLYGWGDEIDSNALEVHIHNLRKKFGHDFIKTIRGVGYVVEKNV